MILDDFISYLNKNGLKYVLYKDSETLSFSLNNLNYLFQWQEQDLNYFRIALPNVDNPQLSTERTGIINQLVAGYKVAKAITMNDGNLWLVAESFIYSSDNVDKLFARMIYLLGQIFDEYRTKVGGGTQ